MQLRCIAQAVAEIPFVSVRNAPRDDVAKRVVVEMQTKGERVVETNVFVVDGLALDHANAERDDPTLAAPDKESALVRQALSKTAEIVLRQQLKAEGRAVL